MYRPVPPPGSRAVLLGRHSSDMQNPRSARDQLMMGAAIVARQLWHNVGEFADEAKTGRTTVGRDGLYAAMAMAEAGECDVFVVEDVSRIARDAADLLMIARRLTECNVVIYTFEGGVMGGLELAIRAQMAEEASKDTARRVIRGHRAAAARGRVIGGVAYGYRLLEARDANGEFRAIDEETAQIVRRIFRYLEAGMSAQSICGILNREGVPPPKGQLWRPKAITGNPKIMDGIGRNPLYAGKLIFGKSKSKLVPSTGRVKVTPAPSSDRVLKDVPHLQIVPTELWEAVQELLDSRCCERPNMARQPTYLLSGRMRCGTCGAPVAVIGSEGLGCTGRRYGNGCANRRRVNREDLERLVLDGLTEKVLQPDILEHYIAEYRAEHERAVEEYSSRSESIEDRLKALDQEISNIFAVARAGAGGPGAQFVHDELDRLGAQRKVLEREAARRPPDAALSLEADAVVQRLRSLIADLSSALKGDERDAVRARDIIRSFITSVVITPTEEPGRADGRGVGPVRVTVEGSLPELLGCATESRLLQRRRSTAATQDHVSFVFRYYIDITRENSTTANGIFADVRVFSRMLDDADAPISHRRLEQTLGLEADKVGVRADAPSLDLRARSAVFHLQKSGLIRSVRLANGAGWVWNHRPITNDEWRDRATRELDAAEPIGVIRLCAPEASPIVIGPPPWEMPEVTVTITYPDPS